MATVNRQWLEWSSQDIVIQSIRRVVKEKIRRNVHPARATLRELRNVLGEVEQIKTLPELVAYGVVDRQRTINSFTYAINERIAERFSRERNLYA